MDTTAPQTCYLKDTADLEYSDAYNCTVVLLPGWRLHGAQTYKTPERVRSIIFDLMSGFLTKGAAQKA